MSRLHCNSNEFLPSWTERITTPLMISLLFTVIFCASGWSWADNAGGATRITRTRIATRRTNVRHIASLLAERSDSANIPMPSPAGSIQSEVHLHGNLDRDGDAVFSGRFKSPALHGLNGFFVQAHAERALHADVVRAAIGADDQPEHDGALTLGFAGLLGKFRIGRVHGTGREPAAPAVANTGAASRTHSAATARADPPARARAVGWWSEHRRERISQRACRRLGQADFRRNDNRRLDGESRILVADHYCGRCDLLPGQAGKSALRRGQLVAIASASASSGLRRGSRQDVGADLGDKADHLLPDFLAMRGDEPARDQQNSGGQRVRDEGQHKGAAPSPVQPVAFAEQRGRISGS